MGCTFTENSLLRGITCRTFFSRTLEFGMYCAVVLYTWPSQYGPYNHVVVLYTLPCHVKT